MKKQFDIYKPVGSVYHWMNLGGIWEWIKCDEIIEPRTINLK